MMMADMRCASSLPIRHPDLIFFSFQNLYRLSKTAYLHYDVSGKAKAHIIYWSSQQSLIHEMRQSKNPDALFFVSSPQACWKQSNSAIQHAANIRDPPIRISDGTNSYAPGRHPQVTTNLMFRCKTTSTLPRQVLITKHIVVLSLPTN